MPFHTSNIILPARFVHLREHVLLLVLVLVFSTACERERIVDPGSDTTAPLPPAGLLVESARDGFIFISWIRNREIDLRGYIVYRAEEASAFVAVDTVAEFYFIDEHRSYDSTYRYHVTAIDDAGNESAPSDTVSARARNLYEPETPENLQVNGFDDGRRRLWRLSWTPVVEADLSTYRIYRSDIPFAETADAVLLAETDAAFFDDTVVAAPGWRWFYAVSAVDRGGLESTLSAARSDIIAGRPEPLSPSSDGAAPSYPLFRWRRVSGAASYLLAVSLSEHTGEVWTRLVPQGGPDTLSFRYDGFPLSVGETYFWRVSSVTAANGKPNGVSDAVRFQVRE